MDFDLDKSKFREAVKFRYSWELPDTRGSILNLSVDDAMFCKWGEFVIQRHNKLRDLEAEQLIVRCEEVEIEVVLQDITGEVLNKGVNTAPHAQLDIVGRGRSALLMLESATWILTHSCRDRDLDQILRLHETEKKRQYASRMLKVDIHAISF